MIYLVKSLYVLQYVKNFIW